MNLSPTIDTTLRERRRINRLLDFLKRDDLTGDQMERIGRRLQKSGKRALSPLVRKLWREQNGTAIYRYTCMLDFFDASKMQLLHYVIPLLIMIFIYYFFTRPKVKEQFKQP